MSRCNPIDILLLNAKKNRLLIDLLQAIPPGRDLLLSPDAVEGLETFMREQEVLMVKVGNGLSELPYFEIELVGLEI